MRLVQVRQSGQITLPAEVRKQLKLDVGDRLEAEVREGALILKPVTVVDRQDAWRAIREAQQSARYVGPEPRPSPEEEGEWVAEMVREHRASQV